MASKRAVKKRVEHHEGEVKPEGPTPTGRRVSVIQELQEVGNLMFAVGMVANEVGESASKAVEIYGPGALRSLLCVVQGRVRLLEGALRKETDPALIWNDRNDAPPETLEGDVVLEAW